MLVSIGVIAFLSGHPDIVGFFWDFSGSWASLIIAAVGVATWLTDRNKPVWKRFLENYRRNNHELANQFEALGRRDGLFPYKENPRLLRKD